MCEVVLANVGRLDQEVIGREDRVPAQAGDSLGRGVDAVDARLPGSDGRISPKSIWLRPPVSRTGAAPTHLIGGVPCEMTASRCAR